MNTSWLNHSGHVSAIPRISRTIPGISGTFPRNSGKQSNHKSKNLESTNMCIQLLNSMFFFPPCLNSPIKRSLSQKLSQTQSVPNYAQNYPYAVCHIFKKRNKTQKKAQMGMFHLHLCVGHTLEALGV